MTYKYRYCLTWNSVNKKYFIADQATGAWVGKCMGYKMLKRSPLYAPVKFKKKVGKWIAQWSFGKQNISENFI